MTFGRNIQNTPEQSLGNSTPGGPSAKKSN